MSEPHVPNGPWGPPPPNEVTGTGSMGPFLNGLGDELRIRERDDGTIVFSVRVQTPGLVVGDIEFVVPKSNRNHVATWIRDRKRG